MYKLLIVDDEPQILEGVKYMLDWKSYGVEQIETALTFHEAIDKAVEFNPDIGLFDVCIGDKFGYEIINQLNVLNLKTKYIMMSGYSRFEYAQQAIRCGAKDYLMKPIEREKLRAAIEDIIVNDLHGTLENTDGEVPDIDPVLHASRDSFSNLTSRILMLVQEEYGQDISLKSIAQRFKMNSTYLGQIFLKETNMKFSRYLLAYRMIRVKDMIINTDDKISYIACVGGFSNPNHFYTQFHEYYHCSPTDLRN